MPKFDAAVSAPVVGWLVCLNGSRRGKDYRLEAGRSFIGRADTMDIPIDGPEVMSENHASVVYDPRSGRFALLPGNSDNTRLNGESLTAVCDLKTGDVIDCGGVELCFVAFCGEGRKW